MGKHSHLSLTRPLSPPDSRAFARSYTGIAHPRERNNNPTHSAHATVVCMSIENLKTFDPFAEADEGTGEKSSAQSQDYIHIRIQRTYWHCRPHILPAPKRLHMHPASAP